MEKAMVSNHPHVADFLAVYKATNRAELAEKLEKRAAKIRSGH